MFGKRGSAVWDFFIPLLIALGVLILVLGIYFLLQGNLGEWGTYIKNFLRFGR